MDEEKVILCFDIEADGLLDTITKMHCLCTEDVVSGDKQSYYESTLDDCVAKIDSADVLMGHNIIGYDFGVLDLFYTWKPHCKVIDTLVWSQVLNPDRQLPKGCPTSKLNPLTGKLEVITPHSVAAWGYRVARAKPEHFDWTTFTPAMLHRCEEDTSIQILIFKALMEEAEMTLEEAIK